jgi:hypothetical protein
LLETFLHTLSLIFNIDKTQTQPGPYMALTPFIYMPSDPPLGIHMFEKKESIKKYRCVWRAIRSAARNSHGRKTESIKKYRACAAWHCSVGAAHKVHIYIPRVPVSVPSSELGPPTQCPPSECVLLGTKRSCFIVAV